MNRDCCSDLLIKLFLAIRIYFVKFRVCCNRHVRCKRLQVKYINLQPTITDECSEHSSTFLLQLLLPRILQHMLFFNSIDCFVAPLEKTLKKLECFEKCEVK